MIEETRLFVFILSSLFVLTVVVEFTFKLFQEEPVPMKWTTYKEGLFLVALSYIITFLII